LTSDPARREVIPLADMTPTVEITPGTEVIDGIPFEFEKVTGGEIHTTLLIGREGRRRAIEQLRVGRGRAQRPRRRQPLLKEHGLQRGVALAEGRPVRSAPCTRSRSNATRCAGNSTAARAAPAPRWCMRCWRRLNASRPPSTR
jgi:hypothetical protein